MYRSDSGYTTDCPEAGSSHVRLFDALRTIVPISQ